MRVAIVVPPGSPQAEPLRLLVAALGLPQVLVTQLHAPLPDDTVAVLQVADGDTVTVDADANVAYYGKALTPKEILFDHKAKPSDAAVALVQKIIGMSK